ncbi:MAG: class I SAM-dependent methyltransferase [Eubacteriales bacterium]|nr:class I SAM-dependent methyltransferase [Eubacteriales bacterium]
MKLSKRLETIASRAEDCGGAGGAAADIGTDHGFVPIRLVESGAFSRAIAMDVRKGPLARAQEHIARRGLSDRVETRLSDGLEGLAAGEADTVVIAGMGGELMLRILRDGAHVRETVSHWILSPQSELSLFRHGLEELGLAIAGEVMVEEDGKFYTVMTVRPGAMHYEKEYDYRYGRCLIRAGSPELERLLKRELAQYQEIAEGLSCQTGEKAQERLRRLKEEIIQTEEALHELQTVDPAV